MHCLYVYSYIYLNVRVHVIISIGVVQHVLSYLISGKIFVYRAVLKVNFLSFSARAIN